MNNYRDFDVFENVRKVPFLEGGLRFNGVIKKGSTKSPLVSYITVVLNAEKTLQRTIQSVQAQSYGNIEHIIIDGGSSDGTLEIIQKSNSVDYYISEHDNGVYGAFNKGIRIANGDVVCILNSDDWLFPDSAESAVSIINNNCVPSILFSSAVVHDDKRGKYVWDPMYIDYGSYFSCANVCHNAMYATKDVYTIVGLYEEYFKIAGDFDWIMRCFEKKINFIYSNIATVNYSKGGISSDISKHCKESMYIAKCRFPFLSDKAIADLFFSFFGPMSECGSKLGFVQPDHFGQALKTALRDNSDHEDFIHAVACASAEKFIHPSDIKWNFFVVRIFSKMLNVTKSKLLEVSPRMYKFLKNFYTKDNSK